MHNISLKIIQIEKKMTAITCAYMYMKNTIRLSNTTIPFVHKTGIYSVYYTCIAIPFRLYR